MGGAGVPAPARRLGYVSRTAAPVDRTAARETASARHDAAQARYHAATEQHHPPVYYTTPIQCPRLGPTPLSSTPPSQPS